MLGSQWPRVPISTMTSSEENPLESRLLRACWYISLFSFLVLALCRQSGGGEQDSSIRAISSDFTMTISGQAVVARVSTVVDCPKPSSQAGLHNASLLVGDVLSGQTNFLH